MTFSQLIASPWLVVAVFFFIAYAYSSVVLALGSAYTALLAVMGFNSLAIPMISLVLNLIVTTAGSFNFIKGGHGRLSLVLPFLVSSVPMAYLGGTLQLPGDVFYWVLLLSLMFVAVRLYIWKNASFRLNLDAGQRLAVSLVAGAVLGLVAGIVGIGGGIYLVPLIIILGLGTTKEAAACGAIFIWLNSLSGLVARLQYNAIDLHGYVPLIFAVFLGGALGSFIGAGRYSPQTMERVLGVVVIVAIVLLFRKVLPGL
jgi:uncharacterized membrane protein YfcA